jgi:hypothetical protein
MSDTKTDMSDLFRSLRADSPSTPPASTGGATTAEQRWPILKSFQPRKLAVTSVLTEDEKQVRRSVHPAHVNSRETSPAINSVNQQLARGLSRMLVQKPVQPSPERTSPSPAEMTTPMKASLSTSPSAAPAAAAPAATAAVSATIAPTAPANPVATSVFASTRSEAVEAASPVLSPMRNFFRKREDGLPQAKEVEYSPPLSDDSLRAVLLRLEQAHQPPQAATPRQPSFLSRLGKR